MTYVVRSQLQNIGLNLVVITQMITMTPKRVKFTSVYILVYIFLQDNELIALLE